MVRVVGARHVLHNLVPAAPFEEFLLESGLVRNNWLVSTVFQRPLHPNAGIPKKFVLRRGRVDYYTRGGTRAEGIWLVGFYRMQPK